MHKRYLYIFGGELTSVNQVQNAELPGPNWDARVQKRHVVLLGEEENAWVVRFFKNRSTVAPQEKFKHYRDLWRLNLESWEWEQLPGKGGPCARSGHRMALHRDRIILFGGFQDTGKETVYALATVPGSPACICIPARKGGRMQ